MIHRELLAMYRFCTSCLSELKIRASLWVFINVLNTSSLRLLEIKKGSCEEKLGQIYM